MAENGRIHSRFPGIKRIRGGAADAFVSTNSYAGANGPVNGGGNFLFGNGDAGNIAFRAWNNIRQSDELNVLYQLYFNELNVPVGEGAIEMSESTPRVAEVFDLIDAEIQSLIIPRESKG